MRPVPPESRGGFTLVELLVVVVVLAILAALLLPSLRKISEQAARAQCASNLHQIGIGLFAYAADHGNALPAAAAGPTGAQQESWGYAVWPYIYGGTAAFLYPGNCLQMGTPVYPVCLPNVFRCPATKKNAVPVPGAQVSPPRFSYGLNFGPVIPAAGSWSTYQNQPVPLTAATHRSLTAMVTESSQVVGDCHDFLFHYGMIPHQGGTQILYYDGHVAWMPLAQVPTSVADTFWSGQ